MKQKPVILPKTVKSLKWISSILKFFFLFLLIAQPLFGQYHINEVKGKNNPATNRARGLEMLSEVREVIKRMYYDKNYRGIELDKRFEAAEERIKKMSTNGEIFSVIAQLVLDFNDSHTRFYPPGRANQVEYGFTMQMIGNDCFVVNVKKGSDAEAKGLKAGDVIVGVGQYAPTRENLWKLNYILYYLRPQEKLKLRVLNADSAPREIEITAGFKTMEDRKKETAQRRKEKSEDPYKCQKITPQLTACKLKTFSVEKKYIDRMMNEARSSENFILDLRGNSGGYVHIEEYLTGHFFDRDVKIADFITRNKTSERIAKTQKGKVFKGKLVVLIDSNSASASEIFSRVIQLEKRGKVVGDVSAGAVMTSNFFSLSNARGPYGSLTVSFYGLNVTVADILMTDGNRLENAGVIPDYPVGPTAEALAEKSDPVLAYSANLLGAKLSAAEAGKLYFITEPVENEEATAEGEN
jgi:C-terminal peptidase prc